MEMSSAVRLWIGSPMARMAWAKFSTEWVERHIAGLEMHLGGAVIVAGDEAVQDFRQEQPFLGAEPAHDAEVDGNQPAVIVDEQIARMHVGVKKAVAQCMAEKGLDQRAGELGQVEALGEQARPIGQRRRVDPFQREHFLGGAVPIDGRHPEIRIVLGVLRHFGERRRFEAEIHLDHDGTPQSVDHFDEPQPPRFGGQVLRRGARRT